MTSEKKAAINEEKKLSRRNLLIYGAAGAAGLVAANSFLDQTSKTDEEVKATEVRSFKIISVKSASALEVPSPADPIWIKAPEIEVPLLPQQAVRPSVKTPSVKNIAIRSINDGSSIAFRFEWLNSTSNTLESIDRFRDAVALMLPIRSGIPYSACMGAPGFPVNIFQWKASWQVDLEKGFQGVEASFPNYFNDVTPESILDPAEAAEFYPGRVALNPISLPDHISTVEPLVAEGFGTTTSLKSKTAAGRGFYEDGRWKVVIQLPFEEGADRVRLRPGSKPVAFAVWDGGRRNVGGRKQWSAWGDLRIAP